MKKLDLIILTLLTAIVSYAQEREILISESFSPYSVGSKIAVAANNAGNYWWTTWSNAPGSAQDGVVATYSGNKCGHLTFGNDQVLLLGDEETGNYDLEFDILVPQGKNGYFNILHHFAGANSTWAMQCYLHMTNDGQTSTPAPGHGTIHAGSNGTADVPCVYDAWMHFRLNVNTDTDIARYYYTSPGYNEVLLCTWQWSLDSFGENTIGRTLSAINFFPPDSNDSEFYIDNFIFIRNGGASAPHFVITPNAINNTLNMDETTTVPINLSNTGNSIGDWIGWVDFGHSSTGTQTAELYYHNGEESQGIGSFEAYTREMGIRLPATAYAGAAMGMRIVSAQYLVGSTYQSADHNYIFRIYGQGLNGQPGELLAEKTINSTAAGTWITATFDEPVYMTGQTMWATVTLEQNAGEYPMSMDGGEYGEEQDGNWLSTGGNSFSHCYSAGSFGGAWLITVNCQGTLIPATWAYINTDYGSIMGGASETVILSLNSFGIVSGVYNANVIVETNDANMTHVEIPVALHVNQSGNYYTITATANPSNGGTVTGGGTYQQGEQCTVSATPASNFTFLRWTENGSQVSTNANYTFTVTGNRTLVAQFQAQPQNYNISVSANPTNGGTVTGGGTYQQGQQCTVSATPASNFTFLRWTENGAQVSTDADYTFTVTGNRTLVAEFNEIIPEYTITVNADPTNGGEVSGGGIYPLGATCVLTASPNPDFVFENWTRNDIVVSTSPSFDFEVTRNAEYVAHFVQDANHCTITAIADPFEGGAVSGGGTYELGTQCVLNAFPAVGFEFANWTTLEGNQVSIENPFIFPVTSNAVYVAHFSRIVNHYEIRASVEPIDAGSVIGAATFDEGATCTLIAIPNPTYSFVSWTENGIVVDTNEHYTFTVDRDRILVAVFHQGLFYTITASAGANGTISPPEGEVMVMPGEDKTFTMIPNSGCQVSKVLVDGVNRGPIPSYTFRNVNENHTIHVEFSSLGVEDNVSLDLKVYPNPANDKINIECPNLKRVSVFNLLGVQIESKDVNDDYAVVSTDELPQGTYILKVENNNGNIGYSRFVVVK